MALDTIAGIREYRDQVADKAIENPKTIVGIGAGSMLLLLDTLLGVIDEQDRLLAGGSSNKLESAEIIPLHQRRKVVREAPDLVE